MAASSQKTDLAKLKDSKINYDNLRKSLKNAFKNDNLTVLKANHIN